MSLRRDTMADKIAGYINQGFLWPSIFNGDCIAVTQKNSFI